MGAATGVARYLESRVVLKKNQRRQAELKSTLKNKLNLQKKNQHKREPELKSTCATGGDKWIKIT